MSYPPAPWDLHGQLWLSLFRVRPGDHVERRPGLYGVALVAYEPPGQLSYSELLVARRARSTGDGAGSIPGLGGAQRAPLEITDIWVDSPISRVGGRELWAIPKELCDLERATDGGRVQHTAWSAMLDGSPIATARFSDVSAPVPRLPFRGSTRQRGLGEADRVLVAPIAGTAKAFPTRASWEFSVRGPLAWLSGKRPLASVRLSDFSLSFG
jgi:acetoacetate decarboxylase